MLVPAKSFLQLPQEPSLAMPYTFGLQGHISKFEGLWCGKKNKSAVLLLPSTSAICVLQSDWDLFATVGSQPCWKLSQQACVLCVAKPTELILN